MNVPAGSPPGRRALGAGRRYTAGMPASDKLGRPVRDLRVSVTDKCNFRCGYCMPREVFGRDYRFLERDEILTYEEIHRLARIFAGLGVRKIRLTGGEPLVRKGLMDLIAMLAGISGIEDLTLTTNGVLLREQAADLAKAGLKRVTVSLDSLDEEVFRRMNGAGVSVASVLDGIEAAAAAGLHPVKINAVVVRGINDRTIADLARRFHGTGRIVRFIEYMDVGNTNGWRLDEVVTAGEIFERISAELPLEPLEPAYAGEVARRWRYRDGGGEVGIIASVSRPFCGDCTRARLSPEGMLYTCLFASAGRDLRGPVRGGLSDAELERVVGEIWGAREDRYSEIRSAATGSRLKVEMSRIGG